MAAFAALRNRMGDYVDYIGDHVCGVLDSIPDKYGEKLCLGCRLRIATNAHRLANAVRVSEDEAR